MTDSSCSKRTQTIFILNMKDFPHSEISILDVRYTVIHSEDPQRTTETFHMHDLDTIFLWDQMGD